MSSENKKDLYYAVHKNLEQMRKHIDQHHRLLAAILDRGFDENDLSLISKSCPYMAREKKLKQAIQEAIETLEESRKSFKSKKLELLRKKLTRTLMDIEL